MWFICQGIKKQEFPHFLSVLMGNLLQYMTLTDKTSETALKIPADCFTLLAFIILLYNFWHTTPSAVAPLGARLFLPPSEDGEYATVLCGARRAATRRGAVKKTAPTRRPEPVPE